MKINEIFLRLLLLKGPYLHRAYFLSLYCIFVGYIMLFFVFFSLPPGPGWAMSSRMDRALFKPARYIIALDGISIFLWIAASINGICKKVRGEEGNKLILLLGALPILGYYTFSKIYNTFLSGKWSVIHEFLYHLID